MPMITGLALLNPSKRRRKRKLKRNQQRQRLAVPRRTMALGGGGRFQAMKQHILKRYGAKWIPRQYKSKWSRMSTAEKHAARQKAASAIAAMIGRRKYGAKMTSWAKKGKTRARVARSMGRKYNAPRKQGAKIKVIRTPSGLRYLKAGRFISAEAFHRSLAGRKRKRTVAKAARKITTKRRSVAMAAKRIRRRKRRRSAAVRLAAGVKRIRTKRGTRYMKRGRFISKARAMGGKARKIVRSKRKKYAKRRRKRNPLTVTASAYRATRKRHYTLRTKRIKAKRIRSRSGKRYKRRGYSVLNLKRNQFPVMSILGGLLGYIASKAGAAAISIHGEKLPSVVKEYAPAVSPLLVLLLTHFAGKKAGIAKFFNKLGGVGAWQVGAGVALGEYLLKKFVVPSLPANVQQYLGEYSYYTGLGDYTLPSRGGIGQYVAQPSRGISGVGAYVEEGIAGTDVSEAIAGVNVEEALAAVEAYPGTEAEIGDWAVGGDVNTGYAGGIFRGTTLG